MNRLAQPRLPAKEVGSSYFVRAIAGVFLLLEAERLGLRPNAQGEMNCRLYISHSFLGKGGDVATDIFLGDGLDVV
jgi:hypothetical protein